MTAIEELLRRHRARGEQVRGDRSQPRPSLQVALLTCMDARIQPFEIVGLHEGEAHILRNGGGVVTDDMIRSLALSQHKLGTREVVVMQHTTCGLSSVTEDGFKDELEADAGVRPTWAVEAFDEVTQSVRRSLARVRHSSFLPHTDNVRGFVYDVHNDTLAEVDD